MIEIAHHASAALISLAMLLIIIAKFNAQAREDVTYKFLVILAVVALVLTVLE